MEPNGATLVMQLADESQTAQVCLDFRLLWVKPYYYTNIYTLISACHVIISTILLHAQRIYSCKIVTLSCLLNSLQYWGLVELENC